MVLLELQYLFETGRLKVPAGGATRPTIHGRVIPITVPPFGSAMYFTP